VAETKIAWRIWRSNSSNFQRAVVERRGQAEAVVHEHRLARAVAVEHAADLGDGHVALVDHDERIARQVVDERGRRLARSASRQVARVVLDPLAEPELVHHLEVEVGALLQALQLEELALPAGTRRGARAAPP
jgi:hypothetical protein